VFAFNPGGAWRLARKQGDKAPKAPNLPNPLHSAPPAFTTRHYNPAWESDGLRTRNQPESLAPPHIGMMDK